MKNRDLSTLFQGLQEVSNFKGVKFAYVVAKNRKLIEEELKTLEEVNKPSEQYLDFEQKRVKLCEQHANKCDNGQPKILGDRYDITNMEAFNKDLETLKNEYLTCVIERENQLRESEKLMNEDCKLQLLKINSIYLPNDINGSQIEKIISIIED